MAKKFEDWLDEFVEKGANPEDVTDWPDGGGSAEEGTLFAYSYNNGNWSQYLFTGSQFKDSDVGHIKTFANQDMDPIYGEIEKISVDNTYIDYANTRLQQVMTGGHGLAENGVQNTFASYGNGHFFGVNGEVDGSSTYVYYSRDGFNWDYYELLDVGTTPVQVKIVNGLFVIILKPKTWDPYMVFYGTDITNLKRVDAVGMRIILDICYMPDKQKYVALATGDSIAFAFASIDTNFEYVINDECAQQTNIGTLAHKNVGMHSMVYVQTEDDDHPVIYIYSSPTDSGSSALQKVDLDVMGSQLTTIFSPSSMAKHLITYDNGNGTQSLITTDTLNDYYACYKNDHEFMAGGSWRNFLAAYLPEQDKFIVFCGHREHEEYSAYLTTFDKLINNLYQEDQISMSHPYVGWAIASNGQRCVVIGPYGLLVWDNIETTDAYTIKITYEDGRTSDESFQLQRASSHDIKGFVSDDKTVIPQPVIFDKYQVELSQSMHLTVPGDGTKNLYATGASYGSEVEINLDGNTYYATVYDNEGFGDNAQITLDYSLKKIDADVVFQPSITTQNCGWLENATCTFIMVFGDVSAQGFVPLIDGNCRFSNGTEVCSGSDYTVGKEFRCGCCGLSFTYGAHQLFVWFKDVIISSKTIE